MNKKNKKILFFGYLLLLSLFTCLGIVFPPLPQRFPTPPAAPFMPRPPMLAAPMMPMIGGTMPMQMPAASDDTVINVVLKPQEEPFNPFKTIQPAEKNKKLINDFKIKEASPQSSKKIKPKKTTPTEEHEPINNARFEHPPMREPFIRPPFNNQYHPNNQYHRPFEPLPYHPQYPNNMHFNNQYPHQEFRREMPFNNNFREPMMHNNPFNHNNLPYPPERFNQIHEPLPHPQQTPHHTEAFIPPKEFNQHNQHLRELPPQRPITYQNNAAFHPSLLPQFHPQINQNAHSAYIPPRQNEEHVVIKETHSQQIPEHNQHNQENVIHENNALDDVKAINAKKAEFENELKRLENRKKELIQQEAKKKKALEKAKAQEQEAEIGGSHLNDQMKNALKQIHETRKPRQNKNEENKKTEKQKNKETESSSSAESKTPKITIED